ncbi:Sds3-like-domain-containing protein [Zychaea mexicana]|uniref:Sds3-like-domain-containing protein n=1 Tax=Zychaea mexicana TaxID=64656 RepID=UPI0022FE4BB6|nr:Sds3-like-domain-containing protein [Zychaea mexicana]KAI9496927.1 Sds3-like-domain-containing protein [Zychaea mexicana]
MYHQHHQQQQQLYERHDHHDYHRSNNGLAGGVYSPRRPPPPPLPHLHHHATSQPYHVHHHIQQQQPPLPPHSLPPRPQALQQQPSSSSSSSSSSLQQQPINTTTVIDEQHRYSTTNAAGSNAAAAAAANTTTHTITTATTATANNNNNNGNNNGLYLSEADESEAWYEGHTEGATDSRKQKKRKEYSTRLDKINLDFMDNKDRIYADKSNAIQKEIKQVHNHTHTSYVEGVAELERVRTTTIKEGRLFQQYQEQVTDTQFKQEISHAEEEYMAEKQEMREKLFATLEEKRRKLKEEKDNCELAYDMAMESQARMLKRTLRKRGLEQVDSKSIKRKQLSGPALVFRLKDHDLQSDFQAMQIEALATTPTTSKKAANANKKK